MNASVARTAVVLLACAGCSATTSAADPLRAPVGITPAEQRPSVLRVGRADGTTMDLSALRGRAVLVVAVLFGDLPSQALLRNAEQVARAHSPEALTVLALVGDQLQFQQFRQLAPTMRAVVGLERSEVVLADDTIREGTSVLGSVQRVPTTYLFNRLGTLSQRVEGYQTREQLESLIAPALP